MNNEKLLSDEIPDPFTNEEETIEEDWGPFGDDGTHEDE